MFLSMDEIELAPHAAGTIIPVYAQPGARRNGVVGMHQGRVKVAVTAAPEKGKANAAIAEVLSRLFGLPKSRVTLLSGDTHREKRFIIEGVSPETAAATIEAVIPRAT